MVPWKQMRIIETGEKLVDVSAAAIARINPHPYTQMGAVYPDGTSPFMLREGAMERLAKAQEALDRMNLGYRIAIFDGYRPIPVQRQMRKLWALDYARCHQTTLREAFTVTNDIWANPDMDPSHPPPHSTGGAVDIYLVDARGRQVDMGTMVDADGPQIAMNHFAQATDPRGMAVHANRMILKAVMEEAGFAHNIREWWHFDFGNQRWAYAQQQAGMTSTSALYGRYDR